MAVPAATVIGDFNAGFLPPHLAAPIFERAVHSSVMMSLARKVPLGINGEAIPVVTGRPSVAWVGEGQQKPATAGTLDLKSMVPKKLAAILVVSAEVVRANPGNYVSLMRNELADAFGLSFDMAAFHDEGPDGGAGGGPFATYLDQTTKTAELGSTAIADGGVYKDLVGILSDIVSDTDATGRRYRLTGWALDSVLEPVLRGAVDSVGRPVFVDLPPNQVNDGATLGMGNLLGRQSFMGEGVASYNLTDVVGYGGDFGQAAWGVVGGISFDVSTEASVTINGTLTSLWEHNLVAIRAEAEYGFLCNDANAFSKLTNAGNSPVTSS